MSKRRRNLSLQIKRTLKRRGESAVRIHCRRARRRRNRLDRRLPHRRTCRPWRSRSRRRTNCNRRRGRVATTVPPAAIQGAVVGVVRVPRKPRRLARDRVDLLQPVRRGRSRRPQRPPRRRRRRPGRIHVPVPVASLSLRRRRAAYISFLCQLGTPPGPDRVPFEPPSDRFARTEIARHGARRVLALKGRRSPRVVQTGSCQGMSAESES